MRQQLLLPACSFEHSCRKHEQARLLDGKRIQKQLQHLPWSMVAVTVMEMVMWVEMEVVETVVMVVMAVETLKVRNCCCKHACSDNFQLVTRVAWFMQVMELLWTRRLQLC